MHTVHDQQNTHRACLVGPIFVSRIGPEEISLFGVSWCAADLACTGLKAPLILAPKERQNQAFPPGQALASARDGTACAGR